MSDTAPQGPQIDVGVVLKKLQDKLSEAHLQIIILETQVEMLSQPHDHQPEAPLEDVANL